MQVSATSWKLGYGGGLATRFSVLNLDGFDVSLNVFCKCICSSGLSLEEMLGSMVEVDLGSSSLAISSIDMPNLLIGGFSVDGIAKNLFELSL